MMTYIILLFSWAMNFLILNELLLHQEIIFYSLQFQQSKFTFRGRKY
jgi:hypothetical protein